VAGLQACTVAWKPGRRCSSTTWSSAGSTSRKATSWTASPYLPDFKPVPGDLVFAEVKPAEADGHEGRHIRLCRALARDTGWPVILLIGVPAYRACHRFTPDLAEMARSEGALTAREQQLPTMPPGPSSAA
jgi:hypothetical protein